MHLFDEAVQRVVNLDEPAEHNFVRKHWLAETASLVDQGCDADSAQRRASYRVFSSKPGAYGTGLMQLMESSAWRDAGDLAEAVLLWGGWAYSPQSSDGVEAVESFRRKLAGIELVLHNQDNVEQDLFDSSDYFEFHGGLVAAVASISNTTPRAYFGDSSNPSHPGVRTLQGEALRVYRSRVVNPKWLNAMQRHGYRGGLEMAATVDSLFGFSATAGIVTDWMFEGIAQAYADGDARRFLERDNPWALNVIVERLLEAEQRGLWTPKAGDAASGCARCSWTSEAGIEEVAEVSFMKPDFPFSAIVGQDDLKLALLLAAVDPMIGGVLITGERGTAKSTAARGLAALLPKTAQGKAAPFVELPLGATEDRVVGSLDISKVLQDGSTQLRSGLLARADGGVLYVDEVNLLPDHIVDLLLDAAAGGWVTIERDGISAGEPARFVLIGTMNPEEGDLRPQFVDRFGLCVQVRGLPEHDTRIAAIRRRLEFDDDPASVVDAAQPAERALREANCRGQIPARRLFSSPTPIFPPSPPYRRSINWMAFEAIWPSSRRPAPWRPGQAAPEIGEEHIRRAAELALPHRTRPVNRRAE